MALAALIKLDSVNNLGDARYAAGMGVQFIGFRFSGETVKPVLDNFRAIVGWVAGVDFVAELSGHADLDFLNEFRQVVPFNYIELPFSQIEQGRFYASEMENLHLIIRISAEKYLELARTGLDLDGLFAIIVEVENDIESVSLLASLGNMGTERPFKLLLKQADLAENVEVIDLTRPIEAGLIDGYCLAGGQEVKPGFQYFDHIAPVLEALELED